MNKKRSLKYALVVAMCLFLSYCTLYAAPIPRGRTYEIIATVVSVDEGSKKEVMLADTSKVRSEIVILEVGPMVKLGEGPFSKPSTSSEYKVGDLCKAAILYGIPSDLSIKPGNKIKGNIYSHGDERGDWYILEDIELIYD